MEPYYQNNLVRLYCADWREVDPPQGLVVVSDPPYPYQGEHFQEEIDAAIQFATTYQAERWFWFWDLFEAPPIPLPVVAKHIWHKSNTNRPNNYEMIYECVAGEDKRGSRVFPAAVIHPKLTGCKEAVGHPTQKPVKLLVKIVSLRKSATAILDPFCGTGTTLVAAQRAGIPSIGIDIREEWCEKAAIRLGKVSPTMSQGMIKYE